MIKEKLDHIALSFYLVTGSSREPHTKNKKKNIFATSNQIEANG